VRRTVATLLVVASPLLLAHPVSATEDRAAPLSAQPAITPVVPAPVEATAPALAAPAIVAAPALPTTPVSAAPAAPKPVRQTVKTVRAQAPSQAELTDAAYAAKLQAELCQARQIFCGLGRNGRYPGS
jgi:hypothetical protein